MGSLSQAKILGGIGSILTLLLFVPYFVGTFLVIIGWVLILLAIKNISDAVQDSSIFNNAIISATLVIIGTAVFALAVVGAILGFIGLGSLSLTSPPPVTPGIFGLIAGILVGLVVVWILAIVSSFFLWRSFKTVAARLNMGLFRTGALIYLIGSILTVILVGFLLTFVAQIMFIIAFFSLPDDLPQAWTPQPQTIGQPYPQQGAYPQPEQRGVTACPNCGTPAQPGVNFCDRCGTRLR
jgi:uncharacterized membrane protein